MKCPYPDCTGEVTPGEQFCGECGRALTWQNGQPLAMSAEGPPTMGATRPMGTLPMPEAGPPVSPPSTPTQAMYPPPGEMAAYTPPPGAAPSGMVPPETQPSYPAPPLPTTVPPPEAQPPYPPPPVPPPGYAPTGAMPPPVTPAAPAARRGANPLLLILVGGGAALLLLCLACFGLTALSSILAPSTPEPTDFPTIIVENFPTATVEAFATVPEEPSATPEFVSDTPVLPLDTPEAGVTPDAAATAEASDFDIDFTDYDTDAGAVVIIGTVHNKGSDKLENIQVVGELLDGNGNTVGTANDLLLPLATMEGDQTLPFQVIITEPGQGAERIHVKVHADVYDPNGFHVFEPAQGLVVEGDTLDQGTLGPHITGRVKNNGTQGATLVHVIAAGYDSGGDLVDTAVAYVTSEVAAGDTGAFDLMFLRPGVEIDKYDLVALGQANP